MHIPITLDRTIETSALIDSGAGGTFIDKTFAHKHGIHLTPLDRPIPVYNVDGTQNKLGSITEYTWKGITIAGTGYRVKLLATSLGNESVILGLPWLRQTNAAIDWKSGRLEIEDRIPRTTVEDADEPTQPTIPRLDPELPYTLEQINGIPEGDEPQIAIPDNETQEPSDDDAQEPIELGNDEVLIGYIRGESVAAIFEVRPHLRIPTHT